MARFWVGGTGNWSDTAHWSDTSGGAGGFAVPTAAEDVFFGTLSNATSYTVTCDATGGTKLCRDITFAAPLAGNVTWAGSTALTYSGSFTLYSGLVRSYTGGLTGNATTTGKTFTTAGVALQNAIFNGAGGEWTLQDNPTSIQQLTVTAGTLDTNSKALAISNFNSANSNTRRLKLGSSVITMSGNGNPLLLNGAGLTIDSNTASWVINSNSGFVMDLGGYTLYDVTIQSPSTYPFFSFNGGGTISHTFTVTGNNANTQRLWLGSANIGTAITFTCNGTAVLTNCDFQDIVITGSAAPVSGTSIGDCGGNSGVTFTTPVTVTWRTDSGNLSDPSKWDTGNMPLPQDTIAFDASSFTTSGRVVTCTPTALRMPTLDFSNATNTPTLALTAVGVNDLALYGSLNLTGALKTGSAALRIFGRSGNTRNLTSNGQSFGSGVVECKVLGGTVLLQDAFVSTGAFNILNGTLNTNDKAVQSLSFSSNVSVATALILGSTTWTLTGTGTVFVAGTLCTITPGTSTIKITDTSATSKTFAGSSKTYYNLWLSGGGAGIFIITGANTFNQIKGDTPTAASTLQFTAATTTTLSDWQLAGTNGHTWTVTSVTAANHTLRYLGSVPIVTDYLVLSRSQFSPGYKGFAGANSTDGGNNTGWLFRIAGANKPQLLS